MKVAAEEYTIKPFVKHHGLNISLGDHSLTGAIFSDIETHMLGSTILQRGMELISNATTTNECAD